MLTHRLTAWVLACALATLTGITGPAQAAPDGCIEYRDNDGKIVVDCSNAGGGGGNNGGGGSDVGDRECTHRGRTIPCKTGASIWNGSCYAQIADPQPDKDHPAWGDREDGVIIRCTGVVEGLECDATGGCDAAGSYVWAAGPPDAGPTPLELAERAVAQMQLTVTCAGADAPGTRYDPSYDPPGTNAANAAHSPTCGYMYTDSSAGRPGNAFTITATSYWTVEWSGGGQNGTIPIDQTISRQHQVSELQVILTHD